jgi:hypothetical protein
MIFIEKYPFNIYASLYEGPVAMCNFRWKCRNSLCIFQVVASLATKACLQYNAEIVLLN